MAELGIEGDQRLTYGDHAWFHISANADTLWCVVHDPAEASWQRFLLDTVLWWICLTRGSQVVHASAVEFETGVFAFASRSGGGKTSLAAELLRRGNLFFSDDVLVLDPRGGTMVANPGPPLMNLPSAAGDVSDFGTPLATFDTQGETWVAVDRSADVAAPLAGLFLLGREAGLSLGVERLDATVLDLLPHVWGLPHAVDGPKERFETVSDLVRSTPIYRLSADPKTSPVALAEQVEGVAAGWLAKRAAESTATA